MAQPRRIELEVVPQVDKLNSDVADMIKTEYAQVDAVIGSAMLLDMRTHTQGVDYTAGGQLTARWVDKEKVVQRRAEGFKNPSEFTSRFKDISMGKLQLMLRPASHSDRYNQAVEAKNTRWEAETKKKMQTPSQGLGEFEVVPQRKAQG